MKKSSFFFVLLCIVFSVAKLTAQQPQPSDPLNGPVMRFAENSYNFGTIVQGNEVSHKYYFTNSGKRPLLIYDVRTSCGCLVPSFPKKTIEPGETSFIEVKFSSEGKEGVQTKTISVTSNAFEGVYVLNFGGTILLKKAEPPKVDVKEKPIDGTDPNAPIMTFKELTWDFGTIKQGEIIKHEFAFTNTGKSPLFISNCVSSCGCLVPEWPKEPISPGKTAMVKLTFNSTGKMGPQYKPVTITSNNKSGQIVIALKGLVEARPVEPPSEVPPKQTVNGKDGDAPVMTFKTTTLNFGTISPDSICEVVYEFTNTGRTPLLIYNASCSCGCMAPNWSKDPVAPGKSGQIKVRFNPSGKMGPQQKTTTVNYNNTQIGTVTLLLLGTIEAKPSKKEDNGRDKKNGN